jgi:hypothetical protein
VTETELIEADVLNAWRDAVCAAEMADRLTAAASDAASATQLSGSAHDELVRLAHQTDTLADRAAGRARAMATEPEVVEG